MPGTQGCLSVKAKQQAIIHVFILASKAISIKAWAPGLHGTALCNGLFSRMDTGGQGVDSIVSCASVTSS